MAKKVVRAKFKGEKPKELRALEDRGTTGTVEVKLELDLENLISRNFILISTVSSTKVLNGINIHCGSCNEVLNTYPFSIILRWKNLEQDGETFSAWIQKHSKIRKKEFKPVIFRDEKRDAWGKIFITLELDKSVCDRYISIFVESNIKDLNGSNGSFNDPREISQSNFFNVMKYWTNSTGETLIKWHSNLCGKGTLVPSQKLINGNMSSWEVNQRIVGGESERATKRRQ